MRLDPENTRRENMQNTDPERDEELRKTIERYVKEAIDEWLKKHPGLVKRQLAISPKVAGATVRLSKNGHG
jgi:hypothetical protein